MKTRISSRHQTPSERGMALLSALITVMIVTALAATALWSQWSRFQVESAERQREQSLWLLTGALDWSRVILREDARASTIDTLAEPWAVPLQEVKLSSFIRDQNAASGSPSSTIGDTSLGDQVYLSGQIVDLQSKLNFFNLLAATPVPPSTLQSFLRLFTALHLPQTELNQLITAFQAASPGSSSTTTTPRHLHRLTTATTINHASIHHSLLLFLPALRRHTLPSVHASPSRLKIARFRSWDSS
jgi:general secretion pathway protein K